MLKGLLKPASKPKPATGAAGGSLTSPPAMGATGGAGSAASATGSGAYASSHGIEPTPRADVALPHHAARRERRRSSVVREERASVLRELPLLKDTAPAKKEALFRQKLALCCVLFEWDPAEAAGGAIGVAGPGGGTLGGEADRRAKEVKRVTLLELVDYVNSPGGQKVRRRCCCGACSLSRSGGVCSVLTRVRFGGAAAAAAAAAGVGW
jgi:serine/threonine-protein phosphatase 2A regulatory subunit B'